MKSTDNETKGIEIGAQILKKWRKDKLATERIFAFLSNGKVIEMKDTIGCSGFADNAFENLDSILAYKESEDLFVPQS